MGRATFLVTLAAAAFAPLLRAGDFDDAVRRAVSGLDAPEISPANARKLIEKEHATVLDTRTDAEFAVSRIAGARHVRFGAWQAVFGPRLPPDLPRDRPIVVYCAVGWRSGKVAAMLAATGHKRIFNLVGGIIAWQRAGLPLVDSAGAPTTHVHPYDAYWARFVRREDVRGVN